MHESIKTMLNKYNCKSQQDYINALKEIFQEIALLGLWRSKFYEKAAFYGGTALRILYGLDRFSEDLDFTLLSPTKHFDLKIYNQAIKDELNSFGFDVIVETKNKNIDTNIESAFIKANTKKQLLIVQTEHDVIDSLHHMHNIKIKMEVDTNPPLHFNTETKYNLQPIPFSIRTVIPEDLFAGKVHAILCRPWVKRVKGRDWYDLIWYVSKEIPLNLIHLQERLEQSNAWDSKTLKEKDLNKLLLERINNTDFNAAKNDVLPFIKDKSALELWTDDFFTSLLSKMKYKK